MTESALPSTTILVIASDPEVRDPAVRTLAARGFRPISAGDVSAALDLARDQVPDLILLREQGADDLASLARDERSRGVPVILLADDAGDGLERGAADVVPPALVETDLPARVRSALKARARMAILERLAALDGLTGVGSRRALDERLASAWADARASESPMAAIMIDLDRFKEINDELGHKAGDEVLRLASRALSGVIRQEDFLGRYGGDEFVVVAIDCDLVGAAALGDRLREAVEAGAGATVSVGVASSEDLDDGPGDLLARADAALYRAKAGGGGAVWGSDRGTMRPADRCRAPTPATPPRLAE